MAGKLTPTKASIVTALICISVTALLLVLGLLPDLGSRQGDKRHEGLHDEGHDKKEGSEHSGEGHVRILPEAMQEHEIEVAEAGPGKIYRALQVHGEIGFNEDRVAHIVPRASGIVTKVNNALGDRVTKGQVLAVLESRTLADAKSTYLAALQRTDLAKANFKRIEKLWNDKIATEKSFLEAKLQLAEKKIAVQAAEQKLHAYGLNQAYVDSLPKQSDVNLTSLEMRAPFDGQITEKHITLGEVMKEDSMAFTVADLSGVWVNLTIYSSDLSRVRAGQSVILEAPNIEERPTARILYLGLVVGEATRTALARVVLPNPRGEWRPGLFITAHIKLEESDAVAVAVPNEAIQTVDGKDVVFVEENDVFEARPIKVGRRNGTRSEILVGLKPGERYVAKNAFTLKAELMKGAFSDGHNH